MADIKRIGGRRKREMAMEAIYSQMQRAIDASRGELWNRYFTEIAGINPNGSVPRFCAKFDEAWRRSLLPNSRRVDMDVGGIYHEDRTGASVA